MQKGRKGDREYANDLFRRLMLHDKWNLSANKIQEIIREREKFREPLAKKLESLFKDGYRVSSADFCTKVFMVFNDHIIHKELSTDDGTPEHMAREANELANVQMQRLKYENGILGAEANQYLLNYASYKQVLKSNLVENKSGYIEDSVIEPVFLEAIKKLLDLGANIRTNDLGDNGETALHIATRNSQKKLIKLLVNHNADINQKDKYGRTPLHYAYPLSIDKLGEDRKEIITLLTKLGANPMIKDSSGMTPESSYKQGYQKFLTQYAEAEQQEKNRITEEKRQKELARIEQERQKQAAEAREAARKAEEEKNSFNWAKAAVGVAGFVAGGGGHLDSQAKADFTKGIIQDSMPGVDGVSNSVGALNNATQRYQAQNAAKKLAKMQSSTAPVSGSRQCYTSRCITDCNNKNPNQDIGVCIDLCEKRCGEHTKAALASVSNNTVKTPSKAKRHYAAVYGPPAIQTCNHPEPQVNSFCQTANVYYRQYVKAVEKGDDTSAEIYALHRKTVENMIDLLKRYKGGSFDLSGGAASNSSRMSIQGASPDSGPAAAGQGCRGAAFDYDKGCQ